MIDCQLQARRRRDSTPSLIAIAWSLAVLLGAASRGWAEPIDSGTIELSPNIATRIHWIQFNMVNGRIVASSPMVVPRMIVPTSNQRNGRREMLSIEINGGVASLQYSLATPSEQLQVTVMQGDRLSIQHSRQADGYQLEFQQEPEQPLVLTLDEGGVKRRWQADGFWRLWIAEPEAVRRGLIPLLELLHPSWQLASMGSQIEEALFARTTAVDEPDRRQLRRLVDELASPKFAERQSAQRELYRAGQIIVPFLQNLDKARLDAEQTYRIRWLVDALSVDYADKVDRVVACLAGDPQVWLSLLDRDEPAKRRVALAQLKTLAAGEVDFDPDAPPSAREAQLARLRDRLPKSAATEK